MKFDSQICTTREQSERLLALGVKPETADCMHNHCWTPEDGIVADIPAWSLHRLLIMTTSKRKVMLIRCESDIYDVVIKRIEHEIKEGYFNKEYLEE